MAMVLRVFAGLALLLSGCSAQWYGKKEMGGNPMTMIGTEICHYVLKYPKEGACDEFKSHSRHIIDAHEKEHSKEGADAELCAHIFDIVTQDPKHKTIVDDPAVWDKYCDSHFAPSGSSYAKLKHHYVKGTKPMEHDL
eukprot:COSAG02_NODE_7841_length_2823_cov_2.516887_3_plen_138_part_00